MKLKDTLAICASVLVSAIIAIFLPVAMVPMPMPSKIAYPPIDIPALHKTADNPVPMFQTLRVSVVPGGFRTIEELQAKVSADPVLNEAFRGCFDHPANIYQATEDQRMFVSFRRPGEPIKWSKNPVLVKKGEWLASLSCGKIVLLRCGNFTNLVPAEPSERIDESVLNEPEFPDLTIEPTGFPATLVTLVSDPTEPPIDVPNPPIYPPCCFVPPRIPVASTPEPSILLLTSSGFIAIFYISRRKK